MNDPISTETTRKPNVFFFCSKDHCPGNAGKRGQCEHAALQSDTSKGVHTRRNKDSKGVVAQTSLRPPSASLLQAIFRHQDRIASLVSIDSVSQSSPTLTAF